VPVLFRVSDRLYLQISPPTAANPRGAKSWLARYSLNGRARQMGLGTYAPERDDGVTLAEARARVAELVQDLKAKRDPLEARRAARQAAQLAAARARPTFAEVAALYIAEHEAAWRNLKHRQQWKNTLAEYVLPVFGKTPVDAIDTAAVTKVLRPLWQEKPETASRVRGRIETVLDYAAVHHWRSGENPARWRGHLKHALPKPARGRGVRHHPACPWQQAGAFMRQLEPHQGVAAQALRFLILTASRTGEVLGARWSEIDQARRVWTVPAERMKAGQPHRVPLSDAALRVLATVAPLRDQTDPDALLFPAPRSGTAMSQMTLAMLLRRVNPMDPETGTARFVDADSRRPITAHGFRSTFRDWCAAAAAVPRDLAEAALAHKLRDKVEAAYQREDLLERRQELMARWARFLDEVAPAGQVVELVPGVIRAGEKR
jgi:integrase